jgi:hypothetical protein
MCHNAQRERNDVCEAFPDADDDFPQVSVRVLGRVLWSEQFLDVRFPRVHRREEQLLFAGKALVEHSFRDAGGFRNLSSRGAVSTRAKEFARDAEHFFIGYSLLTAHRVQFIVELRFLPTCRAFA